MMWLSSAYFSNSYNSPLHSLNSKLHSFLFLKHPMSFLLLAFAVAVSSTCNVLSPNAWLASFYHLSVSSFRIERRLSLDNFLLLIILYLITLLSSQHFNYLNLSYLLVYLITIFPLEHRCHKSRNHVHLVFY